MQTISGQGTSHRELGSRRSGAYLWNLAKQRHCFIQRRLRLISMSGHQIIIDSYSTILRWRLRLFKDRQIGGKLNTSPSLTTPQSLLHLNLYQSSNDVVVGEDGEGELTNSNQGQFQGSTVSPSMLRGLSIQQCLMRLLMRQILDKQILQNITRHPKVFVHFSELPCM